MKPLIIFAFHAGDINQDGGINVGDYALWETDANNYETGYFTTDLDGDGAVATSDYALWQANADAYIETVKP